MPANSIPERNPVGDLFAGPILEHQQKRALATRADANAPVVASGVFTVRYGVRYLGKFYSIVPGMIVLDYGDILTGEEAWNFLLKRSNLYPRAEVFGYRSDGRDDMVYVRALDLAQPVEVLVYADTAATTPITLVTALIAEDTAEVAPRLREYLPRYETLEDWRAALNV
jgi:hypothetical protein